MTTEKVTELVLLSDMLEFSPPLNFYKSVPSFEDLKDILYIAAVQDKLSSVSVVQLLAAKYQRQQRQAEDFFRDYFKFAGAEVEITTIKEAFS